MLRLVVLLLLSVEVCLGVRFGDFLSNIQVPISNIPDNDSSPKTKIDSTLIHSDKNYIFEGLKTLYEQKVLPIELASKYSYLGSPPMSSSDFDAKPMVLLLGQYSVGKTSFIRSLIGKDFPGMRIGPEPTTGLCMMRM